MNTEIMNTDIMNRHYEYRHYEEGIMKTNKHSWSSALDNVGIDVIISSYISSSIVISLVTMVIIGKQPTWARK